MIVDVGRDDFHHDVAPWLPFRATWTRDIRANPLPLKRSWRPEQLVDGVPEEIIDLLARWPKATSKNRACAEVDCRYSIARNSRSSSPDASRNAIEDEPDIVITLTPNSLSRIRVEPGGTRLRSLRRSAPVAARAAAARQRREG